jgi:hypothetical protein
LYRKERERTPAPRRQVVKMRQRRPWRSRVEQAGLAQVPIENRRSPCELPLRGGLGSSR